MRRCACVGEWSRGLLFVLTLTVLPGTAAGQSVGGAFVDGEAFGVFAATPLGSVGPIPKAELPPGGGADQEDLASLAVPALLSTGLLDVATSSSVGGGTAAVESIASVAGLNLLAGVVTADLLVANATSTLTGAGAGSSAAGTTFVNLVIAGTPIPLDPEPNTTIPIPGVATIVVNEQVVGGDGVTESSLTVNLLRVTLALGGEIVVGHARSQVGVAGLCTGSGATCGSAGDCGAGEGCCGDGAVEPGAETCDLGILNGEAGSACSRSCGNGDGVCTGSGAACRDAADCPAGEGCCGNGLPEGSEACDDGNGIENDACTSSCEANDGGHAVVGCEDLPGSSIVPLVVRSGRFRDKNGDGAYEQWKSKGEFSLFAGTDIDPDSEGVRLVFNQGSTALYDATLPPGAFVEKGSVTKPKWDFRNKAANTAGAEGWRKGKLKKKLNDVRVSADGTVSEIELDTGPQPLTVRQTYRIDDVCATAVLTCFPRGNGVSNFKCRSGMP